MKKIFILLIIIWGCTKSQKNERRECIGNNGKTFWRMIRSDFPRDTNKGVCFSKNGTFQIYRINKNSVERVLSEIHSDIVFVESEWNFPNDSIMNFGRDVPCKILFFSKDSFSLKPLSFDGWTSKFYKEADQTTTIDTTIPPPVYPSQNGL